MKDLHRQMKLELRYNDGDTKVDRCKCGTYFINEKWNNGAYNGKFLIFDKCQECRNDLKKYNNNDDRTRSGRATR